VKVFAVPMYAICFVILWITFSIPSGVIYNDKIEFPTYQKLAPSVHNATVYNPFPLFSSFATIIGVTNRSQIESKSPVVARVAC
jgi:hypothetical protein